MHAIFEDDRTLLVSSQNGATGRLDLDTMQRQSIGPVHAAGAARGRASRRTAGIGPRR